MPRQQPRNIGVRRVARKSCIHREVERNLQAIAAAEDKSFSWVVADIVYGFFGLTIDENTVKVLRRRKRFNNGRA